ncbi:MAG: hypothetical protein ACI9C4_000858 [Paraglaciecola sp.]|jgi:hypothetical protein
MQRNLSVDWQENDTQPLCHKRLTDKEQRISRANKRQIPQKLIAMIAYDYAVIFQFLYLS